VLVPLLVRTTAAGRGGGHNGPGNPNKPLRRVWPLNLRPIRSPPPRPTIPAMPRQPMCAVFCCVPWSTCLLMCDMTDNAGLVRWSRAPVCCSSFSHSPSFPPSSQPPFLCVEWQANRFHSGSVTQLKLPSLVRFTRILCAEARDDLCQRHSHVMCDMTDVV
jgi:hypothetical protein